jgi:hypothetical protein
VGIRAVAPYLRSNTSAVAGTLYSVSTNTTDDFSGVGRLVEGNLGGLVVRLALMLVLASAL